MNRTVRSSLPKSHFMPASATLLRPGRVSRVGSASARLCVTVALALGAGCAVGPDFVAPTAPKEAGYTPETLAPRTNGAPDKLAGGAVQTFTGDQDIPGQWWSLYHSQALSTLIDAALQASPTLDA